MVDFLTVEEYKNMWLIENNISEINEVVLVDFASAYFNYRLRIITE